MLGHSFIAKQRLELGSDAEEFPSFAEVLHRIVREAGIQQLMAMMDFDRQKATAVAEEMLQGFTDWRIPDI